MLEDAQIEILKAACDALDKAHALFSTLVHNDGQVTPEYMKSVHDWLEWEYDPGSGKEK